MPLSVRELREVTPPLLWEPAVGSETESFADRKHLISGVPRPALDHVVHEARQILGRCVDPTKGQIGSTGLVVGYVQSGKTLSFTTLTALARDNGFGLVIVVAGTKDNLREQTRLRLRDDLGLGHAGKPSSWLTVDNPTSGSNEDRLLKKCIRDWANPLVPFHRKRSGLVLVLKHHKRLSNLCDCLNLAQIERVPVLVIDDEADQATPNTFAAQNRASGSRRMSANYREVTRLKSVLPHHTYVQYTATPQAPLLMSLQDVLSPEFAELLSPGDGYVGGATFFRPNSPYVRTIPNADAAASLLTSSAPPQTLVEALRVFLLGACVVEASERRTVRTMMVHPSQQTGPHKDYLYWLENLLSEWQKMAEVDSLVEELGISFSKAYDDLAATETNLLPLADLITFLPHVLLNTVVRDVNSTSTGRAGVDWSASDYWVLVGGAKLDRGFTVEGLTVTYMPRPLGDGSADSIQQRARFCGYKRAYLGLCRVYLERGVRHAFEQYVEHEADIHKALERTRGEPLRNWMREFILDASMQPTRKGVIGLPIRTFAAGDWIHPWAAHRVPSSPDRNAAVYSAFVKLLQPYLAGRAEVVNPDRYIDRRASSPGNLLYENVPSTLIIEHFLDRLEYLDSDDQFTKVAAVVALRKLAGSDSEMPLTVIEMGESKPQSRSRRGGDRINEVFSGRQPSGTNDRSRLNYGGDRDFVGAGVTMQIRTFDINGGDGMSSAPSVPWYALYIPPALQRRLLLQT